MANMGGGRAEGYRHLRRVYCPNDRPVAAAKLYRLYYYWALKAQQELGVEPSWPPDGYAVKRREK